MAITLGSCIGLSIDIQMNRDGSGRLTMEYRISRMLDTLGVLDGNEHTPAIPVSRQDWDRTMERISGARITSFSSSQRGQDTMTTVTITFDNPQSLLAILDPEGERSLLALGDRSGQFDIILNDPGSSRYMDFSGYDENLLELTRNMFTDYNFSISFSAAENSTLTVTDGDGNIISLPSSAQVVRTGRRVSLAIGVMDLINLTDGLGVSIGW
jgi:hypothetical protein